LLYSIVADNEREAGERGGMMPPVVRAGGMKLDCRTLTLSAGGESRQLTPMECELLRLLIERRDRVVSRKEIAQFLWRCAPRSRSLIDLYICGLRKKLGSLDADERRIVSVTGRGYMLRSAPGRTPVPERTASRGRLGIQLLLEVDAPPDATYSAITTQEGFASWCAADASLRDNEARFRVDGERVVLRVLRRDGPSRALVEWKCMGDKREWAGTTLSFDLRENDALGTALLFTHSNWRAATEQFARWSFVWPHVLERLRQYVRTGRPAPFFPT
jgi:DNA-binding winged helix-turn-helix (wHTH) protein/uncharacterized protein YndB with AHSA1/START domain